MSRIRFEELLLELRRYYAQAAVSDEVMRGVELEMWRDELAMQLTVALRRDVLAHKVAVDTAAIPCRGYVDTRTLPTSVLVELPRPWWARLLRRRPVRVWCPVVGSAGIHDAPDELLVRGLADVTAEYFREFPEATVNYPRSLGDSVPVVVRSEPGDVTWTPDGAW